MNSAYYVYITHITLYSHIVYNHINQGRGHDFEMVGGMGGLTVRRGRK